MLYRLTSKGDLSAESVLKGHKVLKALVPYKDPSGISHFPRTGNIQSTDQSLNRGTREHSGFRAELPSSDTQPSAGMGNARWRSRGPATLACLRTDSTPHASSTSSQGKVNGAALSTLLDAGSFLLQTERGAGGKQQDGYFGGGRGGKEQINL